MLKIKNLLSMSHGGFQLTDNCNFIVLPQLTVAGVVNLTLVFTD